MGKLRIFNDNNSVYIGGKAFQPGSLTATQSNGDITISQNHNSKKILSGLRFDRIVDKNGNAWGADAAATVTALNGYINTSNPDGIIKSTDKITDLTGITAADFASKPGYTVFVGSTDGSLQTSDALLLSGSDVRVNGAFLSGAGTNIALTPGTNGKVRIHNTYNLPASDGTSGQVVQTDGAGNLSFATVSGGGGSDTHLGNANLTADNNRTYDQNGNDLTINPNGGQFAINDSSGSPSGAEIEVGQGTVALRANNSGMTIQGLVYPDSDGTNGQVLTTNGSGTLSFTTVSGGGGGGLGGADQTLTADRTIDTNGFNLDIELDPTGTPDTFTIHDGTHDLFQVDTGTTGTIFSVNDVSGLPKLTVDDSDGVTIDKFKEVKYEKPSNTDFSYQGDVVYFGATTSMTQGDLYYYNSSGNWAQADADAASSSGGVLLAIALGTASDTNGMLLKGTFTMAAGAIDGTEATGDELYVSTTAGHVTNTAPTATGDIVRVVGYMLDGTNGQIWFNPSNDFITLA